VAIISLLLGAFWWVRHRSLEALPHAHISAMEANYPWMIVDPGRNQKTTRPYVDKQDSNILYLLSMHRMGNAIRVDLKTKTTSPNNFEINDWGEMDKIALPCLYGRHFDFSGYYCFHDTQRSTLWAEFRGQEEPRIVRHMFGYPWANQPGLRNAALRTGNWYLMDERDGRKVELLRVKIQNAELNFFDLGDLQISPDERWIIFNLSNLNGRVFIFDRKAAGPEKFND
jgi:hypothetical protein